MNHSGDANKMVDTPRVDARVKHKIALRLWPDFARTLERELNAANDRIKKLEEAGDAMAKFCNPTSLRLQWHKAKEDKL